MTQESDELPTDPVALARLHANGRSLKRADSMFMVRGLLALLDAPVPTVTFSTEYSIKKVEPESTLKSPIKVHVTETKNVFLGPEAARYYTRAEALALALELTKAVNKD